MASDPEIFTTEITHCLASSEHRLRMNATTESASVYTEGLSLTQGEDFTVFHQHKPIKRTTSNQ